MEKHDNKPWDDSLRKLVRANPQAFVSWILGDAEFIDELPEKLKTWNLEVMEQPGLLPLLPLTKGGIKKEVTEQMFARLQASEQIDLLAIGSTLASLVFSREHSSDLEWLHRRLRAMHDILRESPYYQEILQEGYQEGLEEGLEEGVLKGKLEGQRETLLAIVQFRFPKI